MSLRAKRSNLNLSKIEYAAHITDLSAESPATIMIMAYPAFTNHLKEKIKSVENLC